MEPKVFISKLENASDIEDLLVNYDTTALLIAFMEPADGIPVNGDFVELGKKYKITFEVVEE